MQNKGFDLTNAGFKINFNERCHFKNTLRSNNFQKMLINNYDNI